MQMVQTRGGGNSNPGLGEGIFGGGARRNEERAPSPPPPPPPYTADVFFAQFLWSQCNIIQTPAPLFATCLAAATYASSFFPLLLCHIVWPRICCQTQDAPAVVACAVTAATKQALKNK